MEYLTIKVLFWSILGLWGLRAMVMKRREYRIQLRGEQVLLDEEIDSLRTELKSASLEMAQAQTKSDKDHLAEGSRFGGKPYCDEATSVWPECKESQEPLLFLAQVNFAEVPKMEGYPESGLLQLFVRHEKGYIKAIDSADDWLVRWFSDPEGEQVLDIPAPISDSLFVEISKTATLDGLKIEFECGVAMGNPFNWPFFDQAMRIYKKLESSDSQVEDHQGWLAESEKIPAAYGDHWIGGHPYFVQCDIRAKSNLQDLDRVLLHIGFDKDICIGDCGYLNLLISQKSLANRDFEKSVCTWDCS